ncbi:RNA polymerase sigma factor [Halioxenophilus aromaticivorans]
MQSDQPPPRRQLPALDAQIKAAQQGSATAFEAVFDACYDVLYRYAFQWAGNAADAEDIAQLAAIKLAKTLKQFKFESQFTTWLYRLVVTTAIDWARANRRHQGQEPAANSPEESVTHGGFSAVYLQQLINQVAQMGEGFKEAVILVLGEGFSHKEAAQVLKVKESTVSWRIHEVRKQLNQHSGGCHD